jgi:hypothetical protein
MRTSTIPAEAPAFERAYPGTASQPRHVRADLAAVADGCPAAESLPLLASELATNAILHSRSGHPERTFTVRATLSPGAYARVEVEDQGGPWTPGERDVERGRGLRSWQRSPGTATHSPYTGCNAGITHFHADPHGRASICKVGRQEQVDLMTEGAEGLRKLAAIADRMITRHGGCSGCTLHKTCGTCMPLATLYRQANAPLQAYCQRGSSGPVPAEPTGGR